MIEIKELQTHFPKYLQNNSHYYEYMLKEYMQYIILDIIYNSKWKEQFCFIGGTCIRIIHGIDRFSEDLDFDIFDIEKSQFTELTDLIISKLQELGYPAEANDKKKDEKLNSFRRNIIFPEYMFNIGLSAHREKRFLIKTEAQAHEFKYEAEKRIIQKFNVFTQINVVPIDILLSMKMAAMIDRQKGRDYYDCIFLMGMSQPNWEYLNAKLSIDSPKKLKEKILESCEKVDFKEKIIDFQHIIFNKEGTKKVALFPDYIDGFEFRL